MQSDFHHGLLTRIAPHRMRAGQQQRGCVYCHSRMARPKTDSTVLTIRVPVALEKRISREARRRQQTRSQVARAILEAGLGTTGPDLASEARRQSLLVSKLRSERDVLRFIPEIADTTGWR